MDDFAWLFEDSINVVKDGGQLAVSGAEPVDSGAGERDALAALLADMSDGGSGDAGVCATVTPGMGGEVLGGVLEVSAPTTDVVSATRESDATSMESGFRDAMGSVLGSGDEDTGASDSELDDATSDAGSEVAPVGMDRRLAPAMALARGVTVLIQEMMDPTAAPIRADLIARVRAMAEAVLPMDVRPEEVSLESFMPRLLTVLRSIHGTEILPASGINIEAATMALNECCWHQAGLMLRPTGDSYRAEAMMRSWVPTTTTALVALHVLNGNSIHVVCPLLVLVLCPLSVSSLGVDPVAHLRRVHAMWREMVASVDGEIVPDVEPLLMLAKAVLDDGLRESGSVWVRDGPCVELQDGKLLHERSSALMRLRAEQCHAPMFVFLRSHERDHILLTKSYTVERVITGRYNLSMTWVHVAALLTAYSLKATRNETVDPAVLRVLLSIEYADSFLLPFQDLIVVSTCTTMHLYVTLALLRSESAVTCSVPCAPTPDMEALDPRVMPISMAMARVAKRMPAPLPLVEEMTDIDDVHFDGKGMSESAMRTFCERRLKLIELLPTMVSTGKRGKWFQADIKLVTQYYCARLRGERGIRDNNERLPRLLRRLRQTELQFEEKKVRRARVHADVPAT